MLEFAGGENVTDTVMPCNHPSLREDFADFFSSFGSTLRQLRSINITELNRGVKAISLKDDDMPLLDSLMDAAMHSKSQ